MIEQERVELMQVFAILRCLYEVLLYADDDDATLHADVARVCATLIRESTGRLEILVKRYKAGEFRTTSAAPTVGSDAEGASPSRGKEDDTAEGK